MTLIARILVLYWMSGSAFAETASKPEQGSALPPPPPVFDPLSSSYLFKMMLSLFIVLVLMFLVVWLMKRTGRFDGRGGHYPLRVLTQMTIGTRERVLLVAVGDRQMLLGVTHGQIESLGWVDPPIEMDTRKNPGALGQVDNVFARLLQSQIRNKGQGTRDGREAGTSSQNETATVAEPREPRP